MKKQIACVLVILLIVFCRISLAGDTEVKILQNGNFQYVLLENGTAAIVRADVEGELIIPSVLDGYAVTAVGLEDDYPMIKEAYNAVHVVYYDGKELRGVIGKSCTKVTIPDSVKTIGEGAFIYCRNLTNVTLHEGVTTISDFAFEHCRNLKSLMIPDSVATIGGFTFADTGTEITIPAKVTKLDWWVFSECSNLKSVILPEKLKTIGTSAFENCGELTEITIPNSVKNIGKDVFVGCEKLICTVEDNSHAMRYCEDNGIPFEIEPQSYGKTRETDSNLQDAGLISNGEYQYILLEDGSAAIITADGHGECVIPEELDGHPVTSVGLGRNDPNMRNAYTAAGLMAEEDEFASRSGVFKTDITSVTIPAGIRKIGVLAFAGCDKLQSIIVPDGVTEIEFGAFASCKALTSVTIPSSVISIREMAFSICPNLQSVVIPKGVAEIETWTFYGCEALSNVSIPESVTKIAEDAFEGCGESLKCIVIKGSEAYNYCNKQGIQYELNDNKEE